LKGVKPLLSLVAWLALALYGQAFAATLDLRDDWGRRIALPGPPARIVSLAPHATELLFAVGAGPRIVAVDPYSDFPPAARTLPHVTGYPQLDLERLLALMPNLVVVWGPGVTRARVDRMAALGLAVFVSEPRTLDDVAAALDAFAPLSGTPRTGHAAAREFRRRLAAIRADHAGLRPLRVFVQFSSTPLLTLSDRDLIGDALRSCGAVNVFGDLPIAAPQVDPEAVITARPQLVLAADGPASAQRWRELGLLEPRGTARFAAFEATVIERPGPRAIDALAHLCTVIDAARPPG